MNSSFITETLANARVSVLASHWLISDFQQRQARIALASFSLVVDSSAAFQKKKWPKK